MTGTGMRTVTDEFKREAVRLVQTSGRTIGQIDDDLGIGHSTLERRALNMRRDARASIERAAKRAEARARRGANIKLDQHASYLTLAGLGKWLAKHREADLLSGPHEDTAKELARLRKENEILRAERELLKKTAAFFAIRLRIGDIVKRHRAGKAACAKRKG